MYDAMAWMALLAVLALLGLRALHRGTAVSAEPLVTMPFLSGHDPAEHALSRHHVRWYAASVVFLAFDVEMLFMYPWAVVVGDMSASSVVEMFLFLGVLLVGVAWARREGAFRWV